MMRAGDRKQGINKCCPYWMVPTLGHENRETAGGNYTLTSLNIGKDKCIRVLENGAEILYYCDDRAVETVSEKSSIIG